MNDGNFGFRIDFSNILKRLEYVSFQDARSV